MKVHEQVINEELHPRKRKPVALKTSQKVGNSSSKKGKGAAWKFSQETNEEDEEESEKDSEGEEFNKWFLNRKKKGKAFSQYKRENSNGDLNRPRITCYECKKMWSHKARLPSSQKERLQKVFLRTRRRSCKSMPRGRINSR